MIQTADTLSTMNANNSSSHCEDKEDLNELS